MKRLTGMLMVICLLVTAIPVHAKPSNQVTLISSKTDGKNYEEFVQVGEMVYYYSEYSNTTKCISYNQKENLVDYVEYSAGSDQYNRTVYTSTKKVASSMVLDYLSKLDSNTVEQKTKPYDVERQVYEVKSQKSFADDSDKIMKSVYRSGYPQQYTNQNARPVVVSGTYVMIKDSLSYTIKHKSAYTAVANTALSVISAVLSTPVNALIGILSIVSVVNGIYQLTASFVFNTYNVSANYKRRGFINNTPYSEVWKTINMKAIVGDKDATTTTTNSSCDSNYENDRKIAEIAYANYQAGYHY